MFSHNQLFWVKVAFIIMKIVKCSRKNLCQNKIISMEFTVELSSYQLDGISLNQTQVAADHDLELIFTVYQVNNNFRSFILESCSNQKDILVILVSFYLYNKNESFYFNSPKKVSTFTPSDGV